MTAVEVPVDTARLPQVRRIVTAIPGPRSTELATRRSAAVPAGLTSASGVYAAAAGDGVLVDVDGNSFIDLGSGIAVTSVGNSAPRVVDRATRQLAKFTHTCFIANPYESYLEVCETLNRLTPGDHQKRTALFNTGSEALENAVKYARAATGRPAVVVFDHAFHGRTLLTMTMTAKSMPYKVDLARDFGAAHHRHQRPLRTSSTLCRWNSSDAIARPAADGRRRASPSVEACARCAAENASLT